MRKLRNVGIALALGAVAAVPLGSGLAGAQDAGNCGTGAPAVAAQNNNTGGLLGSLLPITLQVVAPITAPVLSPSQCTSNSNSNSVGATSSPTVVVQPGAQMVVPAAAVGGGGGAVHFTG